MGYYVGDIFALSPNDRHSYFFYYIPTNSLEAHEYGWIDHWIKGNFPKIAKNIGPKGVIISPHESKNEEYVESILEADSGGCLFYSLSDMKADDEILHTGLPFILCSRSPISKSGKETDVLILNISACKNEQELGSVIDTISSSIDKDDWSKIKDISDRLERLTIQRIEEESDITDALKLTPNFFGIGIDLKKVVDLINKKILEETNTGNK